MQTWIIYALISMLFAGVTSILAKYGLLVGGALILAGMLVLIWK